jgi:hypothetical protein
MYEEREPQRRRPFIPSAERKPKRAPTTAWTARLLQIATFVVAAATLVIMELDSRGTQRQLLAAEITSFIVIKQEMKEEQLRNVDLIRQLSLKGPLSVGMLQSGKKMHELAADADREIQDLVNEEGKLFSSSAWIYPTSSLSKERAVYLNLQKAYEGMVSATKLLNDGLEQSLAQEESASSAERHETYLKLTRRSCPLADGHLTL